MLLGNRVQLNPELEELRKSVPQPPNVDEILDDIVQKTSNIHAAFLFCGVGEKLLQQLCRCLCATRNSLYYSGWKELGIELGLDPLLPQSLENCNINDQDPVFNMFFAYIQKAGATISKIYKALQVIKRPDVILQTEGLLKEFYDKNNFEITSEKAIIKPTEIPRPPHILKNLEECMIDEKINILNKKKIDNVEFQSAPVTREASNDRENSKAKYDKVVMLTYNAANEIVARKIAAEMRNLPNKDVRIGVLMLDEHADKVNADPETFISNCYAQADYVLPILTTDYLNAISSTNQMSSALGNVDGAYMKYIYTLMTYEYIKNGCRNYRIKCVIPDDEFEEVQQHSFAGNPEFRVWFRLSEIQKFIERIL